MRSLLAIPLLFSADLHAARFPQVDAIFSDYNRPNVPGASVTIIKGGIIRYEQGYGLQDVEENLGATPETNYRLASLTKQFTAMAILLLVEDGKLDLEARLTDIHPSFPAYGNQIRIRHLCHHQSGLRDYEDLISPGQTEQIKDKDVLSILARQSSTYFTPGSSYRYSNAGYAVLATIVEKVSGKTFAEFLRERIFQPLGMRETVAYEKGISEVSHRAYGHRQSGAGFVRADQSVTSAVLGDGGVYTSVRELYLWDRNLYQSPLVSEATLRLAFTPGTLNDGSTTSYGFGWMLDSYGGHRRQHHTGSTIGFRTALQRYPDEELTVIVLVNRDESSPWTLAERVTDLFLPAKSAPAFPPPFPSLPSP